jgi:hypothetical protein
VAPGPASGEDASLQVGPESVWWLDRCFRAPVAAITDSEKENFSEPVQRLEATPRMAKQCR